MDQTSWKAVAPALIAAIQGAHYKSKAVAIEEIMRMAEAADIGVALLTARAQE